MDMDVDVDVDLDLDVIMVMVIVRRTWDMENKQTGCQNAGKKLVWHRHVYGQFTTLVWHLHSGIKVSPAPDNSLSAQLWLIQIILY
jgi:hypothetical protein